MKTTGNQSAAPGAATKNQEQNGGIEKQLEKEKYLNIKEKEGLISFDDSPDMVYYILSTKFLKDWMAYVGLFKEATKNGAGPNSNAQKPTKFNEEIVIKKENSYSLKPSLVESQDFVLVTKAIMDLFQKYDGYMLERKAYKSQKGFKKVEIYKMQCDCIYVDARIAKKIVDGLFSGLEPRVYSISRYASLTEVKKYALDTYRKLSTNNSLLNLSDVKIWRLDSEISAEKYRDHIRKNYRYEEPILPKGTMLFELGEYLSRDLLIYDFAIADDDILVFYFKDPIKGWLHGTKASSYGNESTEKCEYCNSYKVIMVRCPCKKANYCSDECRAKDLRFHSRYCKLADEVDIKQPIYMAISNFSRKGITGLSNLGNTCFMNSCIQCLSNTMPLTNYFLTLQFQQEINIKNPIGTKGKIAVNYAKTIRGLWCESNASYSPYLLKSAIGYFNQAFSGYSQHDSQYLLSYLLDGLHEDLNRVQNKPATECIESKGRPDDIVAKESWINFLKRNQSIIVDLMMGQYKSVVTCLDCKQYSVTFDPFSTLSLPIPQKTNKYSDSLFVFFANYRYSPKKISVYYNSYSVKEWSQYLSGQLKLISEQIQFWVLTFSDPAKVKYLRTDRDIEEYKKKSYDKYTELFALEMTKDDMYALENRCFLFKFLKNTGGEFTFMRPMYFRYKYLGIELYKRIYRFIYAKLIGTYNDTYYNTEYQITSNFKKYFSDSGKGPFELYFNGSLLKFQDSTDKIPDKALVYVRLQIGRQEHYKAFNSYSDGDKGKSYDSYDQYYSLYQCFEEFEKLYKLEPGNEWYCPQCKDFKLPTKQMSLYKTPRIFVVHLKRFKQKADRYFASKQKNSCMVKYPLYIDLSKYVVSKTLPYAYFSESDTNSLIKQRALNTVECSKYELYAVSNHYGSMGGGHYTAYAKNNGSWYDFNDSSVHQTSESKVVSRDAYLLFYRRCDNKNETL